MTILDNAKFRRIAAQCYAVGVTDLLSISKGFSIGFSTVIVPELYKENAEIVVGLEELTWISGINYLVTPVGSLISGPLTEWFGRRPVLFLASVLYLVGWALFHWVVTGFWTLLLAYAMLGLGGGVVVSVGLLYVTEVSEPSFRGAATISIAASLVLGVFVQVLIGNYLHWKTLVLINLVEPLLAFFAIMALPESPMWLASKGRLSEAERALRWLRGWTTPTSVKTEYTSMLQAQSRSKGDDHTPDRPGNNRSFSERYLRRGVLLPFGLATFVYVVDAFGGDVALLTYAVLIFRMLHSPVDEYTAAVFLTGLQVLAMFLLVAVVGRVGKRPPTIASLGVSALCFFGVASYAFFVDVENDEENTYAWIPTLLILVTMFAMAGGIRNAPWFFTGEIFPLDSRSFVVSVGSALYNVLAGLANKSCLDMFESLTLPGAFLLLGVINLVGFAGLYRFMPETEGKSFAEIEEFFVKKRNSVGDFEKKSKRINETNL